MTTQPTRFRFIGGWLRRYREAAGQELQDAASILDCDRSKISRIEYGDRGITPGELGRLLEFYDADPDDRAALTALASAAGPGGWWRKYRQVLAPGERDVAAAERAAQAIAAYAPLRIPGLLQCRESVRAALDAHPHPVAKADTVVAAAMARQDAVLRGRVTPVDVVIGEAALLAIPGTRTRGAQARHLLDLAAKCPGLTIRLLPLPAAGRVNDGAGGFTLLRFSKGPGPGLALLDGPAGCIWLDSPQQVAAYDQAFTSLRALALTPQKSMHKLAAIATRP